MYKELLQINIKKNNSLKMANWTYVKKKIHE